MAPRSGEGECLLTSPCPQPERPGRTNREAHRPPTAGSSFTARALSAHRQPVPCGPPSAADSTPLYRPTRPNVPLTARVRFPGQTRHPPSYTWSPSVLVLGAPRPTWHPRRPRWDLLGPQAHQRRTSWPTSPRRKAVFLKLELGCVTFCSKTVSVPPMAPLSPSCVQSEWCWDPGAKLPPSDGKAGSWAQRLSLNPCTHRDAEGPVSRPCSAGPSAVREAPVVLLGSTEPPPWPFTLSPPPSGAPSPWASQPLTSFPSSVTLKPSRFRSNTIFTTL